MGCPPYFFLAWTHPYMINRSVIRWAGSKRQLIPRLLDWVPHSYKRYVEPFAGSACLFFFLEPKIAVLGDINAELMLTYRQLQRAPEKLHRALIKVPRNQREYYRIRSLDPTMMLPFDRAVRFLFLNRNCFNGVYRLNKRGQFNVPWGDKTGAIPSLADFKRCAAVLRKARLVVSDFEDILDSAKRGDFVYLDPPYSKSVAGEPGLFGSGAFSRHDLKRLADATRRLDRRGATYMLSFEDTPELAEMLPHSRCISIEARRHVAGFSGARGKVSELLFTNARMNRKNS